MPPLTRAYLDKAQCHSCLVGVGDGHKHDEPLYLHGRCHPRAGTRVAYQGGVITIACRECRKLVAEVAVATD